MYVGPFVATWEKIVDIRSILGEGAFMFGKKIAILLSTAMILTGSCVSSVAVHAQTGYAAEYAQEKHRQQVCRALQSLLRRAPVEAKLFTGCTPMETCRYREKGRLRLPMIFHTDQQ